LSSITKKEEIESASRPLSRFGELNDKVIKGLMYLSKIVSKFYLDIHVLLMEYIFVNGYYMARIGEDKYMDDPNASVTNIKQ
jgi:hypothetical protein